MHFRSLLPRLLALTPWLIGVPALSCLMLPPAAVAAEASRRLVVIPFKVLGGTPDDAWLGESFAEQLSLALSQAGSLNMIERAQLDALLKEQGLGQSFMADEASAPQLGRLLGAQQMVLGSIQLQGEQLLVSLRLVDAASGRLQTGQSLQLQGERSRLFELQGRLGAEALQKWAGMPAEQARQLATAINPKASAQAYALYQQGLEGLRLESDQDLNRAISNLKQAIALDPSFTLAYAALSEAYSIRAGFHYLLHSAQSDDMDLALSYAQQALKLGDHPDAVFRALARAQYARGDRAAAIRAIEQALAQNPGDSLSLQAWLDYQPESLGLTQVRQALQGFGANSSGPDVMLRLSKRELKSLKQLKQAGRDTRAKTAELREMLLQVQARQPANPYVLIQIAELEMVEARPTEALARLEQALAMDPANAMIHFAAAVVFFNSDDQRHADFVLARFRRGLELNPAFAPAHTFWGLYAYAILEDNAQAREHLLAAQRLMPDSAVSPMFLARIAYEEKDYLQAYAYFRRALANHGKLLGEDVKRGSLLMALIQLAPVVKPEDEARWIQELRQGGRDIGAEDLRELIDWLARQKKFALALDVFNQLHAASPSLSEADKQLYQKVVLLQTLQQKPEDAAVLNDLGRLAMLAEDFDEAADYLARAYALKPSEPTIVFNLGLLRLNQQADAEAASLFEQVLALQPKHAKARFQLGEARFRLGRKAEAKAIWESLLLDDPGNSDALAALERF